MHLTSSLHHMNDANLNLAYIIYNYANHIVAVALVQQRNLFHISICDLTI